MTRVDRAKGTGGVFGPPGSRPSKGGPFGQTLLKVSGASAALAYGVLALALPHKIQQWMLHNRVRRQVALKTYGRFLESPNYIRYLRLTGAAAVLPSALLSYSAFATLATPTWRSRR